VAEGTDAVRRAFKFRAYPTRPQEVRAARLLADHCDLYNAALEERRRLRRAVAKEWRKVRNRRRDFHYKTAHALVNNHDVIALEKLNTAGMTRRPAPKPDPDRPGVSLPNGRAAKTGLNKSILDVGWAQFASILTAKAESAGRRVVFVNPAGTSTVCHQCRRRCTRPRQDTVICPTHGKIDADTNGARNIAARAGLGSGQAPGA
jgi:putative transposase